MLIIVHIFHRFMFAILVAYRYTRYYMMLLYDHYHIFHYALVIRQFYMSAYDILYGDYMYKYGQVLHATCTLCTSGGACG